MLSSTTPPTSSYAYKRQSLSISAGPRPLQLVEGGNGTPTTSGFAGSKAPSSSSNSSPSPTTVASPTAAGPSRNPRRQSSISYNPPPRERVDSPPFSASARNTTFSQHSRSLSRSATYHGGSPHARSFKSLEGDTENEKERPPLTLVEKHADLLHFIAQKESKCLELRSQLAMHEAELLQLKRKWERIVSRGLERERPVSAGPDTLEGIREGVQGFSRFMGYGTPTAVSHTRSASNTPTSTPPTRHNRTPTSSTSTTASASTCPTSVMGDSPGESISETKPTVVRRRSRSKKDILMVTDTGASPIVSPNPDFRPRSTERSFNGESQVEKDSNRPPSPSKMKAKDQSGKRASLPLMDFDSKSVSSWVGSVVGKKWEEQLTKNQRRASTMFSDVSQSIVQALASPPPQGPSLSGPPSYTLASSILDEEVGGVPALMPSSPSPMVTQKPKGTTPMTLPKSPKTPEVLDEEDEWNW